MSCTYKQKQRISNLAGGESTHPSSSIMVWAFSVSHWEVGKSQQLSSPASVGSSSKAFWVRVSFTPSSLEVHLYHFHNVMDSERTARQKIMAAGDSSFAGDHRCIMTFQLFLATCPAYLALSL